MRHSYVLEKGLAAALATSGRHPALAPVPARIAIVLPAMGAGGSERVVSMLANHWAEQGRSVTLATFEPLGTPPYYALDPRVAHRQLGLPSLPGPPWRATGRILQRVLALRRVLQMAEPELVLSFLTRANIVALLAGLGSKRPIVISERNNPEEQTVGPVWDWLRARLYPRAYCLVTMTERALVAFPPAQRPRGRVIPNAVLLPEDLRPRRDGRTVVAAGRLVPQKGFDLLLEAFAQVAPDFPQWRLVIWGEGEQRAELERQREGLGLRHRVEMPGISAEPGRWVETGDVFVLSSRFEGWGIVLAEAMAAGLPAVAFDCPFGPAEMIRPGANGILVPNGNVEALATALKQVLGDATLRTRLGEAARKSMERFAPAQVLSDWDQLMTEAAASR